MNNNKKIILYAISAHGEGRVMEIGKYDSIEEIELDVSIFDRDVVLKFEYEA